MAGLTFNSIVNSPVTNLSPGTTRWNATANRMEMWDGNHWQTVTQGWTENETLAEMLEQVQDSVDSYVEEDHKDNATIQDAYAEWAEATEKFRVIASMAEK